MSGDTELQKRVLDELAWDPEVNAGHIGVAARGGVVTLTGHVASYAQKVAVERAALRIKGVHAVAEEIEVKLPSSEERTDEEIATGALYTLRWQTDVPFERIQVKVERGHVTLSGDVDWQYQATAAASNVRGIKGVRGVTNFIKVKPPAEPSEVKHEIEEALRRNAELDAAGISVSRSGTTVTLSGHVRSLNERGVAERAAWSAPGVTKVTNEIQVAP